MMPLPFPHVTVQLTEAQSAEIWERIKITLYLQRKDGGPIFVRRPSRFIKRSLLVAN